ncbi:MAG: ferredoxin [Leptospiraceae bacterium]|nr:ferredoxin [Leptospiraceae bacterium]
MQSSVSNAGMYSIQYNRKRCIGCGLCASLAPERWIMNEKDGKAILQKARGKDHIFRARVLDIRRPREADECPAHAISASPA